MLAAIAYLLVIVECNLCLQEIGDMKWEKERRVKEEKKNATKKIKKSPIIKN